MRPEYVYFADGTRVGIIARRHGAFAIMPGDHGRVVGSGRPKADALVPPLLTISGTTYLLESVGHAMSPPAPIWCTIIPYHPAIARRP